MTEPLPTRESILLISEMVKWKCTKECVALAGRETAANVSVAVLSSQSGWKKGFVNSLLSPANDEATIPQIIASLQ